MPDIATLRQRDEKHPGENVDQYALRISSLFTRLLTEAACTTPMKKSPHTFEWERLKIAVFENGLLPAIRLEQIREDPAHSFASARDRARKHASNNLHGVNVSNLSSIASTSPALKTQLETRLDNVQATIASIIDAPTPPRKQHRGRSKSGAFQLPRVGGIVARREERIMGKRHPVRRDQRVVHFNTV